MTGGLACPKGGSIIIHTKCIKIFKFSSRHRQEKGKQFQNQLKDLMKDDLRIYNFLLKVKQFVDAWGAIREHVSIEAYIGAIFEGSPQDYDPLKITTTSRNDLHAVAEMKVVLMAQEEQIEKNKWLYHLQPSITNHILLKAMAKRANRIENHHTKIN